MNNKKIRILIIAVIILAVGGLWYYSYRKQANTSAGKLDDFAKCLGDKNITMYGAYYCSHCQDEKAAFGSSFEYVPYVECTKEVQKCLDAKVEAYPTWIFPDGKSLVGFQELAQLAKESGCKLPAVQ